MTKNNNLGSRSYQLEFKQLLAAVFKKQSYFGDFFGGQLEILDGVQENEHAFYVKTSDIPVVVGTEYNKGKDVAFGEGTGKTSRFGNRTEVIYKNTPADYTWGWSIHEGIDRHTVNNDEAAAVADRLDLQAQAKMHAFNKAHATFIAANAGKEVKGSLEDVAKLFNEASKHFTQVEAVGIKVAKVSSDVYNAIMDSNLTTSSKASTVNIDGNEVTKFKGFLIQEVPDELLGGALGFAYVANVAKAFTGINTARTIESEDFDGRALQGAGKAGEFILEDNKKAVVKLMPGEAVAPK